MKSLLLPGLLTAAFFLCHGLPEVQQGAEAAPDIEWMRDVRAARVKAREEGRPLLVVFR